MAKTLKELGLLKYTESLGGGAFDYFQDRGITTVGIYGKSKTAKHLFQLAKVKGIKAVPVTDDPSLEEANVRLKEKQTLVVQGNISFQEENELFTILVDTPKKSIKRSVPVKRLLMYSLAKRELLDNLLEYKRRTGIEVVLLSLPSLAYARKKTADEVTLFKTYGKMTADERLEYLTNALLSSGKGAEYAQEMIEESSFEVQKNHEGVPYLKNQVGKYVNIQNGHRVVPASPVYGKSRVFTFGNSVAMGMYADDHSTIANVAQLYVNENQQADYNYKFVNVDCGGHPNFADIWKSVVYHQPRVDDVVVIVSWFSNLFEENPTYQREFSIVNPQNELRLFDRPHRYGKYVWSDNINLLKPGYTALGKLLGRKILEVKNETAAKRSFDSGNVALPDLTGVTYWKQLPAMNGDTVDFARANALVSKGRQRWLSFKLLEPLKKDTLYMFEVTLKNTNATRFGPFVHDGEVFERMETQVVKADAWQTCTIFFRPKGEGMCYFALTATDFVNAGDFLSVQDITYQEALHLYD